LKKIFTLFLFLVTRADKHIQVMKYCPSNQGYKIRNSHGVFSVCLQKTFQYDDIGIASFYSTGSTTATMEEFNPDYYTAAHPFLPIPCVAEVYLVDQPHKRIIVKINDRGPLVKQKRIIDLSYKSASHLGFIDKGLARVRVRVLLKATALLEEYGGPLKWKGDIPFQLALKSIKNKKILVLPPRNPERAKRLKEEIKRLKKNTNQKNNFWKF
jgi:rare lipoprotein A